MTQLAAGAGQQQEQACPGIILTHQSSRGSCYLRLAMASIIFLRLIMVGRQLQDSSDRGCWRTCHTQMMYWCSSPFHFYKMGSSLPPPLTGTFQVHLFHADPQGGLQNPYRAAKPFVTQPAPGQQAAQGEPARLDPRQDIQRAAAEGHRSHQDQRQPSAERDRHRLDGHRHRHEHKQVSHGHSAQREASAMHRDGSYDRPWRDDQIAPCRDGHRQHPAQYEDAGLERPMPEGRQQREADRRDARARTPHQGPAYETGPGMRSQAPYHHPSEQRQEQHRFRSRSVEHEHQDKEAGSRRDADSRNGTQPRVERRQKAWDEPPSPPETLHGPANRADSPGLPSGFNLPRRGRTTEQNPSPASLTALQSSKDSGLTPGPERNLPAAHHGSNNRGSEQARRIPRQQKPCRPC